MFKVIKVTSVTRITTKFKGMCYKEAKFLFLIIVSQQIMSNIIMDMEVTIRIKKEDQLKSNVKNEYNLGSDGS